MSNIKFEYPRVYKKCISDIEKLRKLFLNEKAKIYVDECDRLLIKMRQIVIPSILIKKEKGFS